jgi:hypothetical protein
MITIQEDTIAGDTEDKEDVAGNAKQSHGWGQGRRQLGEFTGERIRASRHNGVNVRMRR